MLALVASIHVLNAVISEGRRGWSGQARPWRGCKFERGDNHRQRLHRNGGRLSL